MHLDAKVLKTFWLLLSKPGFLVAEYNKGRRKPYMKPIQVFLVATLLFYFVFPPSYLFFAAIVNMGTGYDNNAVGANTIHYNIGYKIKQIAAQKNMPVEQVIAEIEKEAYYKSKEFLFIILPFFAGMVYLLFRKANHYFIPHLILALNLLSFFIILNLLAIPILTWVLRIRNIDDRYFETLPIIFCVYIIFSVKRVYNTSWLQTIWKSLIMVLWFAVLVLIFRQVITIWAAISYSG